MGIVKRKGAAAVSRVEISKEDAYVRAHMRLAWRYYSTARKECLKVKVCAGCSKETKDLYADHIDPVVDPKKGFVDWNTYYDRMFKGKLQALCKECHDNKSRAEMVERKRRIQNV